MSTKDCQIDTTHSSLHGLYKIVFSFPTMFIYDKFRTLCVVCGSKNQSIMTDLHLINTEKL